MNIKDMGFKLFWTMVSAGLAWAAVEIADAAPAWGALALAGIQIASTWVRQKVGATPPEAPATGAFPLTKET